MTCVRKYSLLPVTKDSWVACSLNCRFDANRIHISVRSNFNTKISCLRSFHCKIFYGEMRRRRNAKEGRKEKKEKKGSYVSFISFLSSFAFLLLRIFPPSHVSFASLLLRISPFIYNSTTAVSQKLRSIKMIKGKKQNGEYWVPCGQTTGNNAPLMWPILRSKFCSYSLCCIPPTNCEQSLIMLSLVTARIQ